MSKYHDFKCRVQCNVINKTSPTKTYTVKGSVVIREAKEFIEMCDEIIKLEKKLAEKPRTITKIRYVEKKK